MANNEKPTLRIQPKLACLLVAAVTFVLLFSMVSAGIAPQQYDLKVGDPAPLTITASKDVVDEVTTGLLKQQARDAVQPSYISDENVMSEVTKTLSMEMDKLDKLPGLRRGLDGAWVEGASDGMLRQASEQIAPLLLTDEQLRLIIEADLGMVQQLSTETLVLVRDILNRRLLKGQEDEAVQKLKRDLSNEGFPDPLVSVFADVVGRYLQPNMMLDEETTERNRQLAEDDVERVVYKKGQNIARRGELITVPQIEMLNELGLLKNQGVDVSLYVGVGLLLLLLCTVIGTYLFVFERDIALDPSKLALLCLICVIVLALSLVARIFNPYLMPVTMGAMLTTLLLKSRLALVTNLVLSVLTGLLATTDGSVLSAVESGMRADGGMFTSTMFGIMLTSFISGSACVAVIRTRRQRFSLLMAGLVVSLLNVATTVAVALINSADLQNILLWASYSGANGIFGAVLCIALQFVLELLFNLDTNTKLTDLSNPNQELLKRLMIEAPGTYHHSMIVANLAEAAALAVGANAMLARVGAYYHDIGKLKRPLYFKENQIHDNPHDRTDPRVSTAILTAHPRDGVEMAQRARLPKAIQEIILQHHGDTPVLYFYDKAVKQGGDVDIQDFRYDGPRPQKAEAAIIMLADTIEAAARAMTDASPESISQLIQRLVRSKLEDGQLDRCSLTFHDLNRVCEAFLHVLSGVYHERIEYPAVNIPERKRLDDSVIEPPAPEPERIGDAVEPELPEPAPEPEPETGEKVKESEDEA